MRRDKYGDSSLLSNLLRTYTGTDIDILRLTSGGPGGENGILSTNNGGSFTTISSIANNKWYSLVVVFELGESTTQTTTYLAYYDDDDEFTIKSQTGSIPLSELNGFAFRAATDCGQLYVDNLQFYQASDEVVQEASFDDMTTLLKGAIDSQIEARGEMPLETRRVVNGLWYTHYSLAPLTAHAQLIKNRIGKNLFDYKGADGAGLEEALDYFLYYAKNPSAFVQRLKEEVAEAGVPEAEIETIELTAFATPGRNVWPINLYEGILPIYNKIEYDEYVKDERPVEYRQQLGFAWVFPTLLTPPLEG